MRVADGVEGPRAAHLWPHYQHLQWPTDTELRKLCGADSALQFWLETMPVQPADEVAKYHEALRSKLASYSRRKYNPQEAEEIRSAVEGVIVKRIAAAAQAGREAAVVFPEPETAALEAEGTESIVPTAAHQKPPVQRGAWTTP